MSTEARIYCCRLTTCCNDAAVCTSLFPAFSGAFPGDNENHHATVLPGLCLSTPCCGPGLFRVGPLSCRVKTLICPVQTLPERGMGHGAGGSEGIPGRQPVFGNLGPALQACPVSPETDEGE